MISAVAQLEFPQLATVLAIGLALIHIYAGKLRFLDQVPRSRWLSVGSGTSVAYVFVHLLPELSHRQEVFTDPGLLGFAEHHVYVFALIGLAVFYGLERVVKESKSRNQAAGGGDQAGFNVFWLHMISFSLYNGLIGYLLVHREERTLWALILFAIAMALHFIVNDSGLRQDHKGTYDKFGRWILAGAIVFGFIIGLSTEIPEGAIAVLFSFLAGSIILNVLKEELPEERESRFWAFVGGAVGYTALLLAL